MDLTEGLTGVRVIAAGDYQSAQFCTNGWQPNQHEIWPDQELESDDFGVRLLIEAGYDPQALMGVMDILEQSSGGQKVPEFQSTPLLRKTEEKKLWEINKSIIPVRVH